MADFIDCLMVHELKQKLIADREKKETIKAQFNFLFQVKA